MTAPAAAEPEDVVGFAARRETCACGEVDLIDEDVFPDEVDDRFLHGRPLCFLLDDEELDDEELEP